jgi:hypothetical protein
MRATPIDFPSPKRKVCEIMPTLIVTHEVDDVEHWLSSTKRDEFFNARGMTVRTFVSPDGSNLVGLIAQVPDMESFEKALKTEPAAEAMKHDGVRPHTIRMLIES